MKWWWRQSDEMRIALIWITAFFVVLAVVLS
jgi:hypothetical protein